MSATANEEFSPPEKATDKTQRICNQIKPEVEKKLGFLKELTAKEYRKESADQFDVYLIKAYTGDDMFVHIDVNENRPSQDLQLLHVKYPVTKDEPLVPFKSSQ